MKKITLLGVLCATLIFMSCNKDKNENLQNNPPLSSTSQLAARYSATDEANYDKTLDCIAYGLLNLAHNATFKNIVLNKCKLQFDGDDNTLLRTIDTACTASHINLKTSMQNSINAYAPNPSALLPYVDGAINGFVYYDSIVYPQIFIPFVSAVESQNTSSTYYPYLVTNKNDSTVLPGYKVLSTALTTANITETYAQANLVWVVSVNERLASAVFDANVSTPTDCNNSSGPSKKFWIKYLKIIEKKEGWGNGRADISYFSAQLSNTSDCTHETNSREPVIKVSNSQLNNWLGPFGESSDFQIASTSNVFSPSWARDCEKIYFILYEKDRRAKFERSWAYGPYSGGPGSCSGAHTLYYISKELPYGDLNFPWSSFEGETNFNLPGGVYGTTAVVQIAQYKN